MNNNEIRSIKYVTTLYHKTLRKHNIFLGVNEDPIGKESLNKFEIKDNAFVDFVEAFNHAFKDLKTKEKQVIKYDFLYNNFAFWHEEMYSEEQYKKIKNSAVDGFYNNLDKHCAFYLANKLETLEMSKN